MHTSSSCLLPFLTLPFNGHFYCLMFKSVHGHCITELVGICILCAQLSPLLEASPIKFIFHLAGKARVKNLYDRLLNLLLVV